MFNMLVVLWIFTLLFIFLNYFMKIFMIQISRNFSVYECGYDIVKWKQTSLNIHFMKIGMVFILFDLEIMYLISLFYLSVTYYLLIMLILNFIGFTLLVELGMMSLKWML